MPSNRFQPPEVRQRQILDALGRLVVVNGIENVTIADVAVAAGIAKGSIYLHYKSRNDLIAALKADLWEKALDKLDAISGDDAAGWADRLDRLVGHWVTFEFDHHELYHAVLHATGTDGPEPWTHAHRMLHDLLVGGTEAGEFNVVDVATTTEFLLHAYSGLRSSPESKSIRLGLGPA